MEVSLSQVEKLVGESWAPYLLHDFRAPYMQELMRLLKEERGTYEVYPAPDQVFRALKECPLDTVKAVIIGQDPYHTRGMADGLCFSVQDPMMPRPPSLVNIVRELDEDYEENSQKGWDPMFNNDLTRLAHQGVLLLNSILTVRKGMPLSHKDLGWDKLVGTVLNTVNHQAGFTVWIGWGAQAQAVINGYPRPGDLYLKSAHPSPRSCHRGFFKSRPFSKANRALVEKGITPIDWYN